MSGPNNIAVSITIMKTKQMNRKKQIAPLRQRPITSTNANETCNLAASIVHHHPTTESPDERDEFVHCMLSNNSIDCQLHLFFCFYRMLEFVWAEQSGGSATGGYFVFFKHRILLSLHHDALVHSARFLVTIIGTRIRY